MKLRPVDFATNGVFLAVLAHWPKFIDETIAQASGAAAQGDDHHLQGVPGDRGHHRRRERRWSATAAASASRSASTRRSPSSRTRRTRTS